MSLPDVKIALVYDRVNTPHGGAENVLQSFHDIFPQAPIFTSVYHKKTAQWADTMKVIPSFLQKISWLTNHHQYLAPLMPLAFESLDLSSYDVIISVTSAEGKGVITQPDQLHICYLLTPPRYVYSHKKESLQSQKLFSRGPGKWLASKLLSYLRWWDQAAIYRPDILIPISLRITQRVKEYYGLTTGKVIYPPVEIPNRIFENQRNPHEQESNYFLVVSRLVYYKRIDLAIQACMHLKKKLIIVGDGPELQKLQKLASKSAYIHFKKTVSASELQKLYLNATALIMPGEEDFGIVALEANSYGKPVIINQRSGAAELITDKIHGVHISTLSTKGIMNSIQKLELLRFTKENLIKNARKYDTNTFKKNFAQLVESTLKKGNFYESQ